MHLQQKRNGPLPHHRQRPENLERKIMTKYRRYHATFKLPNRLVLDDRLSFSARRLGAVFYCRCNALGCCRASLAALARLAKLSVTTVRNALVELSDAGYIAYINTYRYDERIGRVVYAANMYQCLVPVSGDFTLVPRAVFDARIPSSAFVVALYLYLQAGNGTRCFPSLRKIRRDIGAGIATVCRAVKALGRSIYTLHCKRANRSFSNNSYHILFAGSVRESNVLADGTDQRQQLVESAPFPCLKYIAKRVCNQLFSWLRGAFKIGKLIET